MFPLLNKEVRADGSTPGAPSNAKIGAASFGSVSAETTRVENFDTGISPSETVPAKPEAKTRPRRKWLWARRSVQTLTFILFTLPLLISGWKLFGMTIGRDDSLPTPFELPFYGSLSSSSVAGINLLDPFAALEVFIASKEFNFDLLLFSAPIILVYGLIRGRAFCGWVCPVNFVLEGVDFLRTKLGITVKERALPRKTKLVVALAVLVISAATSIPVFEAFSPIGFINKGILFGSVAGAVTFGAIVVSELFWGHRVWCRALCPVGGFYQALGRVGLVNVHLEKDACIHCNKCKHVCLADPEILDPVLEGQASVVKAGDCLLCGKCIDTCPTAALSAKLGRKA